MHGRKSPRTDRSYPCRNDSDLYRKDEKDLEEPGETPAPANNRTHLDERRGGSRHRPAKGVQRLSGFVPFHSQLRGTDIWLLSRNHPTHGKYGRVHPSAWEFTDKRFGGGTLHEQEQDIPGTDIQFRGNHQ